jgi:glycosyltransferase involved in cell wall biosynthesis
MFKLSVIICVFNEEMCLIEALRSLYDNDIYKQTEVIIIDDCSTNPVTLRLLQLLAKHTKYNVIYSQQNLGLSNSRNIGFANATTPYILPLDADDIFPEHAIDDIYTAFTQNPGFDFLVGNYYLNDVQTGQTHVVDCSGITTAGTVDIKKLGIDWKLLGTSPCKKAAWEKVGGYNLKYSYSVQDVDFWIRVITSGNQGFYLSKPIYTWNKSVTGMNMSFNRLDMVKLMEDHREFYLLNNTAANLDNRIFEAYYPYKQKSVLLPLGKKSFWRLRPVNKLRLIRFYATTIFNGA